MELERPGRPAKEVPLELAGFRGCTGRERYSRQKGEHQLKPKGEGIRAGGGCRSGAQLGYAVRRE